MPFTTASFSTGDILTAADMTAIFQNFDYLKGRSTADSEIVLENTVAVNGSLWFSETTGTKFIQVEAPSGSTADIAQLGIDGVTINDTLGLEAGDALKIYMSVSAITGYGTTAESTSRQNLGGLYAELTDTGGSGTLTFFVMNAGTSIDAFSISSTGLVTIDSLAIGTTAPLPANALYLEGFTRHTPLWSTGALAAPTTVAAQICASTLDRSGTFIVYAQSQWQVDASGAQGARIYVDDSTTALTNVGQGDFLANAANDYGPSVAAIGRFTGTSGTVVRLMGYLANSTVANPGASFEGSLLIEWKAPG